MAGRKGLPIADALRAMVWCRAVEVTSGRTRKDLQDGLLPAKAAADLRERHDRMPMIWRKRVEKNDLRWDLYAKGERIPDEMTVELVDALYPDTARAFAPGPAELAPLFAVLADDTDVKARQAMVDDWLFGTVAAESDFEAATANLKERGIPFVAKVGLAWRALGLADPRTLPSDAVPYVSAPSFQALLARVGRLERQGREPAPPEVEDFHALRRIALADVVGVLGLWRLAEIRGEALGEARFLARGILPWVPYTLSSWGIAARLAAWIDMELQRLPLRELMSRAEGFVEVTAGAHLASVPPPPEPPPPPRPTVAWLEMPPAMIFGAKRRPKKS